MHYGWMDFFILITKISINISVLLPEHSLNSGKLVLLCS